MKPDQQTDSLLVDLLLKGVDLLVFGHHLVTKRAIAAQKSGEGRLKHPIRNTGHHQNVVPQTAKSGVKATANMLCLVRHPLLDLTPILRPGQYGFVLREQICAAPSDLVEARIPPD
jgi:hypothetical protein